jgi:hypothetical protein
VLLLLTIIVVVDAEGALDLAHFPASTTTTPPTGRPDARALVTTTRQPTKCTQDICYWLPCFVAWL